MTTQPDAPRILKGGFVIMDADARALQRVIPLQYNADTLSRSLAIQGAVGEGDRLEPLRLKGPPIETIKLDAELDVLDFPENQSEQQLKDRFQDGVLPRIAAIESLVYPTVATLNASHAMASSGTLEILPAYAPFTLFVWSRKRVTPVRIQELSVLEEAFDADLNPIRAKLTLTLRVLSINDVDLPTRPGGFYMAYQQQKERLATRLAPATFAALGLGGLP